MMDRVIKFRGKCAGKIAESQRWLYGWYTRSFDGTVPYISEPDNAAIAVIDGTIGQFTGFLDFQGREIYEDDFIQNIDNGKFYQVKLIKGCWAVGDDLKSEPLANFLPWEPFKVIGNVHDNPELLKGGK